MTAFPNSLPVQAILAPNDLAALLDQAGAPTPNSLRNSLGNTAGLSSAGRQKAAVAGLIDAASGELTRTGRTIADVLLAPATIVSVEYRDLNGYAGRMAAHFPGMPIGGAGVIVNRDGDNWHIGGFVDDTTLSSIVSFIPGTKPSPLPAFDSEMTFDQAAVCCGIVDLLAGEIAEADKRQAAGLPAALHHHVPVTAQRIAGYLDVWWGTAPATRLVAPVFALALDPAVPSEAEIAPVLADFAMAGLLREAGGSFQASDTALALARAANRVEASLAWERLRLDPTGGEPPRGLLKRYLIGGDGVHFSFELLGETMMRLRTESASDYADFFANEFAGSRYKSQDTEMSPARNIAAPEAESAAAKPHNFCTQCGAALSAGDRFCTACGTRVDDQ